MSVRAKDGMTFLNHPSLVKAKDGMKLLNHPSSVEAHKGKNLNQPPQFGEGLRAIETIESHCGPEGRTT
jgi:hypothetical protein